MAPRRARRATKYAGQLLLAIYLVSLLVAIHHAVTVNADNDWLNGWQYRRSILVQSKEDLKDYQLRIVLDTADLVATGKLRSDCGDLRFTLSDGVTEIPYWIEKGCDTTSTVIWLRVPEIPANKLTRLYAYYGNPAATSKSNGEKVFMFFDDFDYDKGWRTSYAKYSITIYDGYTVMRIVDTSHTKNNIAYLPVYIPCNTVIEWRAIQPKYWTYDQFGIAIFDEKLIDPSTGRNYNGYLADVSYDGSGTSAWIAVNHDAKHTILKTFKGVDLSHWHTYSFTLTCNGYLEFKSDQGWRISAKDNSYKSLSFLGIWLDTESSGHGSERPVYYDWVRVRKYAASEPAIVIGAEESFASIMSKTVTSTVTQWLTRTITSTTTWTTTTTSVVPVIVTSTTTVTKAPRETTTTTVISPVPVTITSTITQRAGATTITKTVTSTTTATRKETTTLILTSTVTVEKPVTSTTTVSTEKTVTRATTTTVTVTAAAKPSPISLAIAFTVIIVGVAALLRRT